MDPQLNVEPHPVGNTIHAEGTTFQVYLDEVEAQYLRGRPVSLELEPGETPRRVKDGFVYGGRAFLPKFDQDSLRIGRHAKQLATEMIRLDRDHAHEAAQTRSIPAELEPEIWVRACRQESHRSITRWLSGKMGCTTSYGSVGRVIRRLQRARACADQKAAMEQEVASLRVSFSEVFDTVMDLNADLVEQLDNAADEAKSKATIAALRMHHHSAALLERRLRVATRDLYDAALAPRRQPVEEPISPLHGVARGSGAVLESAPPPEPPPDPISPLHGVARGAGAVLASAPPAEPKIGYDFACPCGSGRKYQWCCLESAAPVARGPLIRVRVD